MTRHLERIIAMGRRHDLRRGELVVNRLGAALYLFLADVGIIDTSFHRQVTRAEMIVSTIERWTRLKP